MGPAIIWSTLAQLARDVQQEWYERDELVTCISSGNLPMQGGRLVVHYLGRKRFAEDFLMFFDRDNVDAAVAQKTSAPMPLWQFIRRRHAAQTCPAGADLFVIDSMWEATGPHTLFLAPHLNAVLPVQSSLEAQLAQVRSKGHRRKLQAACKKGFSWRATRSMADFNLFYDVMYAPFVHERFRFGAHQVKKSDMAQMYRRRGLLLFVEMGDVPVSGAFLYTSRRAPGRLFYWKYGLADAATLSPNTFGERNAMTEAMVLQYAVDEQYTHVEFGLTPALPLDGIFMHKKRVGNDFTPTPNAPKFRIIFGASERGRLLSRFPMVLIVDGALQAHIGFTGELTAKRGTELQDALRACSFTSLQRVRLFTDLRGEARTRLEALIAEVQPEVGRPIEMTALAETALPPETIPAP